MDSTGSGPIEAASLAVMSDSPALEGAASPAVGGRGRGRLVAGWHFARHLLEMVVAMGAGMVALGAALGALGEPPGYDQPLVEYGLMGLSMSAPMVAWMRHRGHAWSDGLEMTAAMLLPLLALAPLAAPGVAGLDGHARMMLAHVAMLAGMVALMVYRRDHYTHGSHRRRP